jgi:hypothetical protein
LKIGDVIERLDGVPVEELVVRWTPYYAASNQPTRLRDIAQAMTRGPCSAARASVSRASQTVQITAQRQPLASLDQKVGRTHDLPGDTFRLLSDQVAYLKLSSVQAAQVSNYVDRARGTKGLVIDIRNYPSEFVVFALGSLLVDRPTQFARFTVGDLDNPGAFRWSGEPLTLSPQQPHYSGKVVILVDEISLSQAEYTTMAFRFSGERRNPRSVNGVRERAPLKESAQDILGLCCLHNPTKGKEHEQIQEIIAHDLALRVSHRVGAKISVSGDARED